MIESTWLWYRDKYDSNANIKNDANWKQRSEQHCKVQQNVSMSGTACVNFLWIYMCYMQACLWICVEASQTLDIILLKR